MLKVGKLIGLVIAVSMLLSSFATRGFSAATTMEQILKEGKLTVSMELGNVPWNFKDPKTGKITGMATELARLYAENLGVDLEIKAYDWAGVIPALITGRVDMVATCLSRTIPRSAKISYTEPYMIAPGKIVAPKGKFKSVDDLNKEGVTISTTAGSVFVEEVKKRLPKVTMKPLPSHSDTLNALLVGRVSAISTGLLCAIRDVHRYPDKLEVVPGILFYDSFAFAVRHESTVLLRSFNLFVRLIKADGTYAELYEKWIETEWKPEAVETAL